MSRLVGWGVRQLTRQRERTSLHAIPLAKMYLNESAYCHASEATRWWSPRQHATLSIADVIHTTDNNWTFGLAFASLQSCSMTKHLKTKTIAVLENEFPAYCIALRRLVEAGSSLEKAKRTVCWDYLQRLHSSLPKIYHSPEYLFYKYISTRLILQEV